MPLTTHVLDTAGGTPAASVTITLYALAGNGERTMLARAVTDDDGRTDVPLLAETACGVYELVFAIGAYFTARAVPSFYDEVPVRFRIDDAAAPYHVPLLVSPWGYSTYRGS